MHEQHILSILSDVSLDPQEACAAQGFGQHPHCAGQHGSHTASARVVEAQALIVTGQTSCDIWVWCDPFDGCQ